MMHLSYEEQLTLVKRLAMAQGVSESDAASLAAVVTHSDFTGTYSHGLSRLCIYLRQYMAGASSVPASSALPRAWAATARTSAAAAITATAWPRITSSASS